MLIETQRDQRITPEGIAVLVAGTDAAFHTLDTHGPALTTPAEIAEVLMHVGFGCTLRLQARRSVADRFHLVRLAVRINRGATHCSHPPPAIRTTVLQLRIAEVPRGCPPQWIHLYTGFLQNLT